MVHRHRLTREKYNRMQHRGDIMAEIYSSILSNWWGLMKLAVINETIYGRWDMQ